MTRPRARPKPGRYWVVLDRDGDAPAAKDRDMATFIARAFDRERPQSAPHHIVECVPMPRVTIGRDDDTPGFPMWSIRINGFRVYASSIESIERERARDLRRALRGK